MGRVFIEQAALNLLGSVLDTPDFFWTPGVGDHMQSVYDRGAAQGPGPQGCTQRGKQEVAHRRRLTGRQPVLAIRHSSSPALGWPPQCLSTLRWGTASRCSTPGWRCCMSCWTCCACRARWAGHGGAGRASLAGGGALAALPGCPPGEHAGRAGGCGRRRSSPLATTLRAAGLAAPPACGCSPAMPSPNPRLVCAVCQARTLAPSLAPRCPTPAHPPLG